MCRTNILDFGQKARVNYIMEAQKDEDHLLLHRTKGELGILVGSFLFFSCYIWDCLGRMIGATGSIIRLLSKEYKISSILHL